MIALKIYVIVNLALYAVFLCGESGTEMLFELSEIHSKPVMYIGTAVCCVVACLIFLPVTIFGLIQSTVRRS